METVPEAEGILIIDTDLEVDFAPPKGYVEPAPKPRPPPPTMASKLQIDNKKVESIPPSRTSTPSASGNAAVEGSGAGASALGSFKGQGQSLSGKKTKGKKERPVEPLDPFSLIRRTDLPKVMTNDTQIGEKKVPAALNLPFGKLYFGYDYVPLGGHEADKAQSTGQQRIVFSGAGQTLSGRAPRRPRGAEEGETAASATASPMAESPAPAAATPFGGAGQTLGAARSTRKRERKGGRSTGGGAGAIVIDDSD